MVGSKENNMVNGSIDFVLGQIQAKLEDNDIAHNDIKGLLFNLHTKLDTLNTSTNKTITDLCSDVEGLKVRASVWGGTVGFIVSAIMGIVGWFVVHIQGK
jgi:hypothetical protein